MNVRFLALEIIYQVVQKGAYSNIELDQALRKNPLKDVDRSLLTMLVYGTLQNYIYLEWELDHVITRKSYKTKIKILLLVALYQMRYLSKIPMYAIINESVEIAKELDGPFMGNFVNAVLHRLSKETFTAKASDFADVLEYEALISSHPVWLLKMWEKQYSREVALKIVQCNQKIAPFALRVNTLVTSKENLLQKPYFSKGNLSQDALFYHGQESISDIEEFKTGEITVQDEASQMAVLALNPTPGSKVLDMCAAPGSKTSHMAQLMKNQGEIVAVELYDHRLELLIKGIHRLGVKIVTPICHDALTLRELYQENSFDSILLDAPCSGFGVIRRKPDMLVHTKQNSLDSIIHLQKDLFDVAVSLLKESGTMVYSTCTLNKKENENQVERVLAKYPFMKLVSMQTIFPYEYDSDGFFIAKLIKTEV